MRTLADDLSDAFGRLGASDTGVAAAYLFGSHAEGRAHRESDVDVGVLFAWDALPTAGERFDAGLRLAARLSAELSLGRTRLDLVVLNDDPPGLARRIVTAGRPVAVADAEAEHAFRRDAQLRAADVEPFLRRARRLEHEFLAR